jgi:hypothetical protein
MEFFSNLSREVAVVVGPREEEGERSKLKVGVGLDVGMINLTDWRKSVASCR